MRAARRPTALRPRKTPVQARSRETVHAILGAAARVFASHGYAAGTTNHIAERAGVSVGSLYEYFPNKDALLVALMEGHLRESEAILRAAAVEAAAPPSDLRATTRRLVRAMVDLHARDRALHRVLFEEAPLPPRVRRMVGDLERQVTDQVELFLRAHPAVTAPDPRLAAGVVVQAVEGLTHKLVVYGERDQDLDAYVEEMVTLVTAYLTAARPHAPERGRPLGSLP
jgi:AcrR family transcriptional regulator